MRYRISFEYERQGRQRVGSKDIAFEVPLDRACLIQLVEQRLRIILRASSLAIFGLEPLGARSRLSRPLKSGRAAPSADARGSE